MSTPLLTALIADWGGAGEEVAESLHPGTVRRLLAGAHFVAEVTAALPGVSTPYTVLCDGSGAFPGGPWFEEATHALANAGVSAVTMAIGAAETYGTLQPCMAMVRSPWLQKNGLYQGLQSFGWAQMLDLYCSVVVTSRFSMRRVLSDARQVALGQAYYDNIRDIELVERLCGQSQ